MKRVKIVYTTTVTVTVDADTDADALKYADDFAGKIAEHKQEELMYNLQHTAGESQIVVEEHHEPNLLLVPTNCHTINQHKWDSMSHEDREQLLSDPCCMKVYLPCKAEFLNSWDNNALANLFNYDTERMDSVDKDFATALHLYCDFDSFIKDYWAIELNPVKE